MVLLGAINNKDRLVCLQREKWYRAVLGAAKAALSNSLMQRLEMQNMNRECCTTANNIMAVQGGHVHLTLEPSPVLGRRWWRLLVFRCSGLFEGVFVPRVAFRVVCACGLVRELNFRGHGDGHVFLA